MIFVTVGSQMPFDRLVGSVDLWAGRSGRADVVAQIGPSDYRAQNIQTERFLSPALFQQRIAQSTAIVAHAGMGTIISALQLGKPLLVMPRLGERGETRNDHQVATARHFADSGRILAAYSEAELFAQLERLEQFRPSARIEKSASGELLERIRRFVFEGD